LRRNIYLDMKPPAEALEIFLKRLNRSYFPGSERVPVTQALDRVTAAPVYAAISSPHFHAAAMDGFAVKALDTFGAGPDRPIVFQVGTNAWPVNTGRPVPEAANAVIMIEDVHFISEEAFEVDQAVVPWQHVRRVGEDFVASEMILPAHRRITAYDQGALLAGGISTVEVVEQPRVVLIPTGTELVPVDLLGQRAPAPGETIEFNTVMLASLVEQVGGIATRTAIVADTFDSIRDAIRGAVDSDVHLVVINAGSSAGSEDYAAAAIRELGEVLVHGVAMMPGKPTILGIVDEKPVIGNPGYPVSAVLSFELFGLPVLELMQGLPHRSRPTIPVRSARKIPSKLGREEFFRVKLGKVGNRVVAAPLPRGAGSITTLTKADGIIRIGPLVEGVDMGAEVNVELLRDPLDIERTVVIIGSHDLTLDVLADELGSRGLFLSSSHVGSLGGLLALKNHTAHLATSHLLDVETGQYNWSYIRRYIPEIPVKVIRCVSREQGFIVPKGNPKGIKGFEDLTRDDVTFINRQSGAGTRVLLDYHLDRQGIDRDRIIGYGLEEYTHTAVAAGVLSGVADVGMGVLAAAKALDLDFVPVATEEYELVIPEEFFLDEKIQALLEALRSDRFKQRVAELGGYGVENTGMEVTPRRASP
jgi:putative molybdopterin biosynthesis protein